MSFRTTLAATFAATLFSIPAFADGIMVMDPYARAASPSAKSGAAFMMIHNETGQDDTLIAARSDAAARVELHTHIDAGDGVMQMVEVEEGFPIAAGDMHHMKRGGDHVMLMGLTGPLEQGASIDVTLVFENAGEVVFTIPVDNERKPPADAHGHGGHGDHDH
ncbi:copper chaperone PCu(A)C [Tateyamaria sp. ANG-S1]|uniref:copper chaperone PCu(A)C n=1 Tax=Tateyamaria sp. ANG-S1 TaxID=1577905 RepID=UPI00057E2325|nr:copper chaperone PCu(A)C [Tateyamaria sp. ANG-S1]KIC51211.1 copper-binding protein [Tateyamaria sp. ANG-S1]